jgi:2,5-dichlorohydroquinone reductive dechlorinase
MNSNVATIASLTANLQAALGGAGELVGDDSGALPRFQLFHAANSICSQKVRVVLAQLKLPYVSHSMNIFAGQTYLPDYVRLRMIGCERSGGPLVTAHSGSTSMSTGGCDPAVVPTLVDLQTNEVIVDSKGICLYIDRLVPDSQKLRPAALEKAIDAQLAIVDGLPNYQMLAGQPVGTDRRPERLRETDGVKFSMSKVNRCDNYLKEFAQDKALVDAYHAKRSKELDAAKNLFSDEAMKKAYAKTSEACAVLENHLTAGSSSTWLLGNAVTMADLFWAIELLRLKNLGANTIWEGNKLPAVTECVAAAQQLPSIQSAVLRWPGAVF